MNKLSIVILNFNTKDYLLKCLDRLYRSYKTQIASGEYEIIVVDNASTDGSVEALKAESGKRKAMSLRVMVNKENMGFAAGNNVALNKIRPKYALLLNPDTEVDEKAIPKTLEFMEKNKEVAVATCKVILPDGSLYYACHRGFPTPWSAFCYLSGLSRLFPKLAFFNGYTLSYLDLDKPHEIDACSGSFMMIRSKLGQSLGWLDEDYFWYGEDLDFCYRVKKAGFKVYYVPEGTTIHYWGAASGLKKTTSEQTSVDWSTKLKATKARFEVMKIFYDKHYKDKYSWLVRALVIGGIKIKYLLTLAKLKLT